MTKKNKLTRLVSIREPFTPRAQLAKNLCDAVEFKGILSTAHVTSIPAD